MDRGGWRAFAKGVKLHGSAEGEFAASAGREGRKGPGKRSTGFRAKAVCDSPDVALPIHVPHPSASPTYEFRKLSRSLFSQLRVISQLHGFAGFRKGRRKGFAVRSFARIRSSQCSQFASFAVRSSQISQISQVVNITAERP